MPYRRTENVERRLAARHAAIIAAARQAASEGGMAAVQIAPVAQRAGIAAGTVYRYFPGKTDLVAALLTEISEREIAALRRAADVAPGPLSALSAAIMTFRRARCATGGWLLRRSPNRSMPSLMRRGFPFARRWPPNFRRASLRRSPAGICRNRMRRWRGAPWSAF